MKDAYGSQDVMKSKALLLLGLLSCISLMADNASAQDEPQAPGDSEPLEALAEAEEVPEAVTPITSFAAGAASVEDAASPAEPAPEATSELLPEPTPPRQLVLEFSGNCWAEVRDATGRAHVIGEKRAGARYVLGTDLGPFKIILGDASVVSITLDGEPYDLAPHTRGNVARFTLDTSNTSD